MPAMIAFVVAIAGIILPAISANGFETLMTCKQRFIGDLNRTFHVPTVFRWNIVRSGTEIRGSSYKV